MFWIYNQKKLKLLPYEYFDPKQENRVGSILSQKAVNLVRKKQLEHQLIHDHKRKLSTLLKPCDYNELEWPVLIGIKHNTIAIVTDEDIGSGSYGRVYLGFCLDTEKPVSVKIQPLHDNNPNFLEEAHAEVINTKKMNQLIDFFCVELNNTPHSFLVKNYAYGVDIFNILYSNNRKNKLSLGNKLTLAIGLIEALKLFHQQGFIHRDLSLGNIIWDSELNRAELIDFAKMICIGGEKGVWAQPDGGIRGLAPELTKLNENGHVYYTKASDIYALGIIFCDIFSDTEFNFDPKKQLSLYIHQKSHKGVSKLLIQAAPDIFLSHNLAPTHFDKIANLLKLMLDGKANKRPSLDNLLSSLKWIQRLVENQEDAPVQHVYKRAGITHLTL